MPKRFLLAVCLILLCSSTFAISAQDAINFATKQNNFLNTGETVEVYPNVSIKDKGKSYWVVTALSGNSLAGFIPVRDKAVPELPDSMIARRELMKTAYVLRNQMQLNQSSSQQGLWLFDAANVKFFSDLSQDIKNERIDLTTIGTELELFPLLQNDVDALYGMLSDMYPLANDISQQLLAANSFENSFVAGPDTNRLKSFKRQFSDSFSLIAELEGKKSDYLAELDKLRQAIALTSLAIETKQSLNSLANVPSRLQQFGSKASIAIDLEEKIEGIFDSAATNVDSFAADLETRESKNIAFQAIYGTDQELLEQAGYNSLSQLFDVLLSEDYYFYWKSQASLATAEENWGKAISFYQAGSFSQAKQYATKAKRDALKVFKEGLQEDKPIFDMNLLITGIVLLIVALIIIYAVRNREKIAGFVSKEGEEVKVYDWEK